MKLLISMIGIQFNAFHNFLSFNKSAFPYQLISENINILKSLLKQWCRG